MKSLNNLQNGRYTVYTIQHKTTRASEVYGDLKSKMILTSTHKLWGYTGTEYFGEVLDPHIGTDNDLRPVDKQAHWELSHSNEKAGIQGFYTLSYALQAIKRLIKADADGEYDYIDDEIGRASCRERV